MLSSPHFYSSLSYPERMDRTVQGRLNYIGPMTDRPRYYAGDGSRDVLTLDPRTIEVEDARLRAQPHSLARAGFALLPHKSAVSDFRNSEEVARLYRLEIQQPLLELTNADTVVINGPPVRRLAEVSTRLTYSGQIYNARRANFVHVDMSNAAAAAFANRWRPKDHDQPVRRFAHYNLWRVFSPPPQDVPLAVCDSRSLSASDLVVADAVTDIPGKPESSYEGLVVRYNPRHRWSYFSNMSRDEVLVFKSHDSDTGQPNHVPHTGFNDPTYPSMLASRASIEVRGIAYWFER